MFLLSVPIVVLFLLGCSVGLPTPAKSADISSVTLTGQRATLYWGQAMTVTAQHSDGMSLHWQLDGASLIGTTDATVSVGRNLAKGDHRLEVTVSKDGAKKDIGWDFTVEQVPVSVLLSEVSEAEILKTTTDLVNFGTRFLNTPGNKAAGSYLYGRLAALPNLKVAYHSDRFNNVIGTLPSAYPSSDVVYVTGAHYDSTAYDTNIAPGATDNASGVAIVLEFARIMSQYKFEHTVIFGFWNGEEVPPGGAEDFAYDASSSFMNIGLYVNLDSSSYDPDNHFKLYIMYDDNTTWVADMMTANNSLYNLGLVLPHNEYKCNSDYVPFRRYGYPAVMTHSETHGPGGTSDDTVDKVSTPYAAKNGRLCLSVLAQLAGE